MVRPTLITSMVALVAGCSTVPAAPPPHIQHVVLVKLHDPAETGALLADCQRLLVGIPTVKSFASGRPLETGRSNVDSTYDLGLTMSFGSDEEYTAYLDHPQHLEIVRRWAPRLEWMRVYDINCARTP